MTDTANRLRERGRHIGRAVTIALQQVKSNALRRLLTDARHAAQRIDQANQQR